MTRQWIENSRRNVATHGFGTGAVVLRETGQLIGWCGFARPEEGGEEIIYGLDQGYWGAGLGTELLAGLLLWARTILKLESIRATVHSDNSASIAMLERAGFRLAQQHYLGDPHTLLYICECTN